MVEEIIEEPVEDVEDEVSEEDLAKAQEIDKELKLIEEENPEPEDSWRRTARCYMGTGALSVVQEMLKDVLYAGLEARRSLKAKKFIKYYNTMWSGLQPIKHLFTRKTHDEINVKLKKIRTEQLDLLNRAVRPGVSKIDLLEELSELEELFYSGMQEVGLYIPFIERGKKPKKSSEFVRHIEGLDVPDIDEDEE
jgi:hypothetical protein